jgi:hypothetical protein
VIGEAQTAAADHRAGTTNSFERPTAPQPVVWPGAATTQPMPPASPPNAVKQTPRPEPQHVGPLNEPVAAEPADPWGHPTGDPWIDVTPGAATTDTLRPASDGRGRRVGAAIGLFAAGAVSGALVTGIFTGWGSNDASALTPATGQSQGSAVQPGAQPPAQGQLPGAGQSGQGGQGGQSGQAPNGLAGRDGEVRLVGALTAVSGSRVTVESTAGSATYTISSSTRILRNGAVAQASALRVGDAVLVHVFPSSSSDGVLELIYARGSASGSGGSSDDSSDDDSTT